MTEMEVRALLAIVVSYDNRRPTIANITAWHEAAERGRWTFDDAREAIHQHYATASEFLMPAHITALVKAKRQEPERFQRAALEAAPPADPERVRSVVNELAAKLGWRRQPVQHHDDAALAVECPHCHARAGSPCSRLVTRGAHRGERRPLPAPHPSRAEAAERAAAVPAVQPGQDGANGAGPVSTDPGNGSGDLRADSREVEAADPNPHLNP